MAVFTSFSRLARTVDSEPASPSTKTLVLSHTMASAPSSPMRRSTASSVTSPNSGSGSIFQSPVWNTVPSLVRIASALGSRIECVMVISSSSNGGRLNLPPNGISVIGTASSRPASVSLRRSTEAANGVA